MSPLYQHPCVPRSRSVAIAVRGAVGGPKVKGVGSGRCNKVAAAGAVFQKTGTQQEGGFALPTPGGEERCGGYCPPLYPPPAWGLLSAH